MQCGALRLERWVVYRSGYVNLGLVDVGVNQEVVAMPLYMTQFAYTPDAWKALVKEPEDRAAVFAEYAQKLGGRMISLYYCMGEYDGLVIFEAPDEATAAAILFTVIAPGHLKATRTTVLMSVEQTMEAMHKAHAGAYPGPKLWSPMPS